MSQSTSQINQPPRESLPGIPQGALTHEQHLEAIRRVQDQADHRVKLGTQLFKAAEAHTHHYKQLLGEIKVEQESLRQQVDQDVANSLKTYDQWIGDIDQGFGDAMAQLEDKISRLQDDWQKTQTRIEMMMGKSQAMLEQSQSVLEQTKLTLDESAAQEIDEAVDDARKSAAYVTTSRDNENVLARVEPQVKDIPDVGQDNNSKEGVAVQPDEPREDDEETCGEGITDARLSVAPSEGDDDSVGEGVTDASVQTNKVDPSREPTVKIYSHLLNQLLNHYDKSAGD